MSAGRWSSSVPPHPGSRSRLTIGLERYKSLDEFLEEEAKKATSAGLDPRFEDEAMQKRLVILPLRANHARNVPGLNPVALPAFKRRTSRDGGRTGSSSKSAVIKGSCFKCLTMHQAETSSSSGCSAHQIRLAGQEEEVLGPGNRKNRQRQIPEPGNEDANFARVVDCMNKSAGNLATPSKAARGRRGNGRRQTGMGRCRRRRPSQPASCPVPPPDDVSNAQLQRRPPKKNGSGRKRGEVNDVKVIQIQEERDPADRFGLHPSPRCVTLKMEDDDPPQSQQSAHLTADPLGPAGEQQQGLGILPVFETGDAAMSGCEMCPQVLQEKCATMDGLATGTPPERPGQPSEEASEGGKAIVVPEGWIEDGEFAVAAAVRDPPPRFICEGLDLGNIDYGGDAAGRANDMPVLCSFDDGLRPALGEVVFLKEEAADIEMVDESHGEGGDFGFGDGQMVVLSRIVSQF